MATAFGTCHVTVGALALLSPLASLSAFPCCCRVATMTDVNPQRVLAKPPQHPRLTRFYPAQWQCTQPWLCGERGMQWFLPAAVLYMLE